MPLIRSTDTPLRVDTQRTLGLVLRNGTHCWSLVGTRYMAGEVTHCREAKRSEWLSIRVCVVLASF